VGPLERSALLTLLCAGAAQACEFPEQGGSPLRAAVSAVKYLPETEAWEKTLPAGTAAQYVLHLDRPRIAGGHCYWTLEVRAGGSVWRRFLVAPDGSRALPYRGEDR
jgi:hypothetical protein